MPNGHLSAEPGGPTVCQVAIPRRRTHENAIYTNFLERRKAEVRKTTLLSTPVNRGE
jgi:hypothetical protein